MKKKINVLQVMDTIGVGGTENFVMNLFRQIDKEQFHFDFLVFFDNKNEYKEEVEKKESRVFLCKPRKKKKVTAFWDIVSQIKKVLSSNSFDIIHINSVRWMGLLVAAIPATRCKGLLIITHSHGIGESKNKVSDLLDRMVLRRYISKISNAGFACSSLAGKNRFTDSFIRSNRYHFIPNGISVDEYLFSEEDRIQIRKRYRISDDVLVIGTVGRLEHEKNQKFLIDLLSEKPSQKMLFIIGDGSLSAELKQYAKTKGVSDRVIFPGSISNIAPYYSAMDCFLLPSLFEGFPFVLVEAQVNGLQCIVSDNMAEDVNISGGVTFIGLDQPLEIWMKNINSVSGRADQEMIRKVKEQFDIKAVAEKIETIYKSLMVHNSH